MSSTNDTLVAASPVTQPEPAAAQPETSAARKAGGRYLSLEILRAVAILVMISEHFCENWVEEIMPPQYGPFVWFMGQLPPALFLLLVGLSYSLWLGAQARANRSNDEIVKYSLRRGLAVLALGFAVNVFLWKPESTFDWDVLLLIGASAIILIPMRNWRPDVLIFLCIVIILVSPPLRDLAGYRSFWSAGEFAYKTKSLNEVLLAALVNGHFPLMPWLIYPIAGLAIGHLYYREENRGVVPSVVLWVGVVLLAISLAGEWIALQFDAYFPDWVVDYYAAKWPAELYPWVTTACVGWVGLCMMSLWILNRTVDLNPKVTGTGPVLTFFRLYSLYALSAYVAHIAFTLWLMEFMEWWDGKRPGTYFGKFSTLETALLSSFAFIIGFYLILLLMHRYRKYSMENFMRWISS